MSATRDLPPQLRELNESVEKTELGLRELVAEALEGDPSRMPPHVLQKVEERILAAARKNPAIGMDHLETLEGKLEYADLRELQDTITGKDMWGLVANRFGTKESLAVRFGQLAELRNGIRHTRTVDEVTRKDGEAALLWFRNVLAA